MSIHEVQYDSKGRIAAAWNVDETIDRYMVNDQPSSGPKRHYINWPPRIMEAIPDGVAYPDKLHALSAIDHDTVMEELLHRVTDKAGHSEYVEIEAPISHHQTEINNIRIGERGFVWTEPGQQVDVYVAPTPASAVKGFRARLSAALLRR